MRPVLTATEMRAIDAASPVHEGVLIERAGWAVARAAVESLGGSYGRRVVVVCGKGNNGADGRVAARHLRAQGVRVLEITAVAAEGARLPTCDLVVDAAYGTGFRGEFRAPDSGDASVLAVDVPTGSWRADRTVTFAALKPQIVFQPERMGAVDVVDIGLDVSTARIWLVDAHDAAEMVPARARDAHKYASGVAIVAGSPGMSGAPRLTSEAAMRAGAGYCRLAVPGGLGAAPFDPVVLHALPDTGWAGAALEACERMSVLAIGPGLGHGDDTQAQVRTTVAEAEVPVVVDADGLFALGGVDDAVAVVESRRHPTILTPHDGEFARLAGQAPPQGEARIDVVRSLAERLGCIVLLKGPVTVIADPAGSVRLSAEGSPSLATAGTGDVLTGVIAAFVARGLAPLEAAGAAAAAHGAAAHLGPKAGLVASDLSGLVARLLSGAR